MSKSLSGTIDACYARSICCPQLRFQKKITAAKRMQQTPSTHTKKTHRRKMKSLAIGLSFLLVAVTQAQNGGGGMTGTKPESNQVSDYRNCVQGSNQLMRIPAIRDEVMNVNIHSEDIIIDESTCATVQSATGSSGFGHHHGPTEEVTCTMDFSTVPNDLQQACEANGGTYQEAEHKIVCTTDLLNEEQGQRPPQPPSGEGGGTFEYEYHTTVLHLIQYPVCVPTEHCDDDDVQRLVSRNTAHMSYYLQQLTGEAVCTSHYGFHGGDDEDILNSILIEEEIKDANDMIHSELDERLHSGSSLPGYGGSPKWDVSTSYDDESASIDSISEFVSGATTVKAAVTTASSLYLVLIPMMFVSIGNAIALIW